MAKILDRVIGIMGFADDEIEEKAMPEEAQKEGNTEESRTLNNRRGAQVVSIHSQKQVKVVLVEPTSFEESQNIADQLKNHRPVIVNLENAERNLAKRLVDFVSGATYALGGNMQKVGNGIFLFVPSNIDITGEVKNDIKDKGLFWPISK